MASGFRWAASASGPYAARLGDPGLFEAAGFPECPGTSGAGGFPGRAVLYDPGEHGCDAVHCASTPSSGRVSGCLEGAEGRSSWGGGRHFADRWMQLLAESSRPCWMRRRVGR